ncbi:hypothetical protein MCOR27_009391 [Pyricularia oryzae]|uniref:Major facilitator superfamily (MFS) profile domain-containing protein n=2 Tax=Pyricularia TaxID=48558 RepID=A0ABQ8N5K4_PYRGI|nr:hypothetical protein MCOR01_010408 [Pyricularia oryzae]KAI6291656.1 hypothetical protein MCOR33_010455 [Pyricularia grisea]KAH9438612.1 hypothetical protein MCOR02_002227 [Pyricularia oryzae]KAI6257677.1 hypothetical protein MCOR19_005896 [Pyricularia oryzae]KAI6270208.1 hypothetical protein MCOR27_009391 [Pyricularia oryzae]
MTEASTHDDKMAEQSGIRTDVQAVPQAVGAVAPVPTPTAWTEKSSGQTNDQLSAVEQGPQDDAVAPLRKRSRLGERPAVFKTTVHEVLFVFMATSAVMSWSFLVGAVATVTAQIGHDLGMSQGEITWIAASTSLTAGAFQLALGQLADLLGRRLMFISGLASFSLFAVVAGFAQNPFWMDILCGFLGISTAMMVPPAIGILGASYARPSKRKNIAFSAFSSGNPVGFALGSILGGVAAKVFNWRAIFFMIAIIWGVLAVVAFWVVPSVEAFDDEAGSSGVDGPAKAAPSTGAQLRDFFRKFDTLGAALTLFGTGFFTAAITLAPHDGWAAPQVLSLLIVGFVMICVFLYWETYWPHPLMPPKIWKDGNFSLLIASLVLGIMAFNSSSFWLSLFLQQVQSLDSLEVGVRLLPQTIAGLTWNIVAGVLLHRVNNTILHGIGAVAYLVANLLLSFMRPDSSYWAFIFPSLIIQVIGADFQFNVVNMYVMQSLPSHQQALAGGIFNTMVRLCSTLALGISTAVYGGVEQTEAGRQDPMLGYTRALQVSVALAAAGILFVPFIRVGTQGNDRFEDDGEEQVVSEKK